MESYIKEIFEMVSSGLLNKEEAFDLVKRLSDQSKNSTPSDLKIKQSNLDITNRAIIKGKSRAIFFDWIVRELAQETSVSFDHSVLKRSVVELGLSSLTLTSFSSAIRNRFKIVFSPTLIFEYPTVQLFLENLYEMNWIKIEESLWGVLDPEDQLKVNDDSKAIKVQTQAFAAPFNQWWGEDTGEIQKETPESSSSKKSVAPVDEPELGRGLSILEIKSGAHTSEWVTAGAGEVLLLMGGLGTSLSHWLHFVDYFKTKRRVIFYYPPGHGRSKLSPSFKSYKDIVDELVRSLGQFAEASQWDILGYSLGGLFAQQLALSYPERVRTLTLLSSLSLGSVKSLRLDGLIHEIQKLPEAIRARFSNDSGPDQEVLEFYKELNAKQSLDSTQIKLRAPSLLMYGTEDRYVLPDWSLEIKHKIPEIAVRPIAGAGHFPQETHMKELLEGIETQLRPMCRISPDLTPLISRS